MKRKRLANIRAKWSESECQQWCEGWFECVIGQCVILDYRCKRHGVYCSQPDEEYDEAISQAPMDIVYLTLELHRIYSRTANRMYTLLLILKYNNIDLSKDINKKIYGILCDMEL